MKPMSNKNPYLDPVPHIIRMFHSGIIRWQFLMNLTKKG